MALNNHFKLTIYYSSVTKIHLVEIVAADSRNLLS